MRLAASVVFPAAALLLVVFERSALARETVAVDDAREGDTSGDVDTEAIEEEALGLRSNLRI
jgi:hypothetical protein